MSTHFLLWQFLYNGLLCFQLLFPHLSFFNPQNWRNTMLLTIGIILIILWLVGVITTYTIGGFIHILLVIAIIVVLLRIIRGKKIL